MKLLAALVGLCFVGCASRPLLLPVPEVNLVKSSAPVDERVLIVLLPGARSDAVDFAKYGFGEPAEELLGGKVDVVAIDLHRGYYEADSAERLLHDQVVAPARARGYREVWLAGISMGGLGAIIYELRYPGTVNRLLLTASYLGEPEVIEEVRTAGGIANWEPGQVTREDYSRRFWGGIKSSTSLTPDRLHVGYGESDRFAADNAFFARQVGLEDDAVKRVPGGHRWEPWKKLWPLMLEDAADTLNR